MSNVQWMLYSLVRLYLFKCDVCVLNYIWIKPKRFLIILSVFGSDFYHSLWSCSVLTFVFIFLSMFCIEKQVSEFFATRLWLANREIGKMNFFLIFWFFGREVRDSFHWFWSLDYVLESFCTLGWDFHYRDWEHIGYVW